MEPADLSLRLSDPRVVQLITDGFGSRDAASRALAHYESGDWAPFGLDDGGQTVGFIGVELVSASDARIRGLAVAIGHRGQGIGRRLVEALRAMHPDVTFRAETDSAAVGFYRRCGFRISTLGEKYPGVERFECVLPGERG